MTDSWANQGPCGDHAMRKKNNDEILQQMVARLRAMARARRLLLAHIPDMAGVSRSAFWDVLAGRRSPTLGWVTRIAAALRCEPAHLLFGPLPRPVRLRPREE